MRQVDQKTEINSLDGTPDKRLFWSIMSDYDFKTAITELVDNCFDIWIRHGRHRPLQVTIEIDIERQVVQLQDNAGGVSQGDLHLLITPGGSANDPYSETIGIFGVGSKRAVVAIAEHIKIRTRVEDEPSFQIDIDPEWLQSQSWRLPAYQIPDIESGNTIINFSYLRRAVTSADVEELRIHLGETYGLFLSKEGCEILLQGLTVEPTTFEQWAYPPENPPQRTLFPVQPVEDRDVLVEVKAGLILDRDPVAENYGVYIYCNDRLIVKELRTKAVGYNVPSEAGRPHPDASLCRVVVHFAGAARLMPWNSSKNDVVPTNMTFMLASPIIVQLCAHFSKLSRALKSDWENTVFLYTEGEFVDIPPEVAASRQKVVLPPIPRTRHSRVETLKEANRRQIDRAPYLTGLLEAIAAVDLIERQHFETGNRIALILLDSTFEIALKEHLVHNKNMFTPQKVNKVLGNRTAVIDYLRSEIDLDDNIFALAEHYYDLRNKLVHERATVDITPSDVNRYREAIQKLLSSLFYVVWP